MNGARGCFAETGRNDLVWLRSGLCCQRGILFRCVHIDAQQGIRYGDIFDGLRIGPFHLPCVAGDRSRQKSINHVAAHKHGVTVTAVFLRSHAPLSACESLVVGFAQLLHTPAAQGWTVNKRDHGRGQSLIENFTQPNLQGTKLTAIGVGILDQQCSFCRNDGREVDCIFSSDDDDGLREGLECSDGGGEQSLI